MKALAAALLLGALARSAAAQSAPDADPPASGEVFPADDGPASVDVSSYPKVQQTNYGVFMERCSKCHSLARALGSELALPDEWAGYVRKMRRKQWSEIDAKAQAAVLDFLVYDSSVRKKALIERKLRERAEKSTGSK